MVDGIMICMFATLIIIMLMTIAIFVIDHKLKNL